MERMFEQMRRSMWGADPRWWFGSGDQPALEGPTAIDSSADRWSGGEMNLSLETDEDGYVAFADLPGFEKDEITLRFDDGLLTVEAEHEVTEDGEYATSRRSRHVYEQLRLPAAVVEDEITATYRNGVLEVHLPTEEEIEEDDDSIIDIE